MSNANRFRSLAVGLALASAAAGLAGCGNGGGGGGGSQAAAVGAPQTCYRLPTGDPAHAVVLSGGDSDLMTCAMHVEAWRLMKGQGSVTGLYQGRYVFASADGGITSSETLQAPRFHVYTPGQQADIDAKVKILIARQKAGGDATTGGT
jgi:hypothetical protein